MAYQRKYRTLPETSFASYDFYDLFTGTGYKNFYLCDIITGADTVAYLLTEKVIYSNTGYAAGTDVDWDLSFEVPITIEGDCVFNIFMGDSGTHAGQAMTIKFYKVDAAAAETQIGSTTTITKSFSNDNQILSGKVTLNLMRMKAGEKLRVSIAKPTAAPLRILCDPKDRDTSAASGFISSASRINLPIRL